VYLTTLHHHVGIPEDRKWESLQRHDVNDKFEEYKSLSDYNIYACLLNSIEGFDGGKVKSSNTRTPLFQNPNYIYVFYRTASWMKASEMFILCFAKTTK
jgi:hypothetical protein